MQTFKTFIDSWTDLIGTSISGLLLTTATAIFFYSIVRFIMNRSSGDAKGLEDAKSMMGWSIIGLTVMFSIWGIVSFLQTGILGSNNKSDIVAPSVKLNTQTQSQTQRTNSTVNSNTSVNTGTNSNYSNEGRGSVYDFTGEISFSEKVPQNSQINTQEEVVSETTQKTITQEASDLFGADVDTTQNFSGTIVKIDAQAHQVFNTLNSNTTSSGVDGEGILYFKGKRVDLKGKNTKNVKVNIRGSTSSNSLNVYFEEENGDTGEINL